MRRDADLVRELLLKLEALPMSPGSTVLLGGHDEELAIDGYSADEIDYHLSLIKEAGFIEGPKFDASDGRLTFRRLSWEGHEFVDAIRDPEAWKRTKAGASKVGGWTFGLLKQLGTAYFKQQAKDRLGLDL